MIISDLITSLELPSIQNKYLSVFISTYTNWHGYYGKRDIIYEILVYKIIYDFNKIKHLNIKIKYNKSYILIKKKICQMSQEISTIETLLCIKGQKAN